MKILKMCLFTLLAAFVFLSAPEVVVAQSESTTTINSIDQGFVFPEGKNAEEIIAQVYSENRIEMAMNDSNAPDNYWCNPEQYVLVFPMSPDFSSDLGSGAFGHLESHGVILHSWHIFTTLPIF